MKRRARIAVAGATGRGGHLVADTLGEQGSAFEIWIGGETR